MAKNKSFENELMSGMEFGVQRGQENMPRNTVQQHNVIPSVQNDEAFNIISDNNIQNSQLANENTRIVDYFKQANGSNSKQKCIYLTKEQIEITNEIASYLGVNFSTVVRDSLGNYIKTIIDKDPELETFIKVVIKRKVKWQLHSAEDQVSFWLGFSKAHVNTISERPIPW